DFPVEADELLVQAGMCPRFLLGRIYTFARGEPAKGKLPPLGGVPESEIEGPPGAPKAVAPFLAVLPERPASREGLVWLIPENPDSYLTKGLE
ncbi:unnamed protein product, partial [Prorocentrum cordatum]